MRDYSYMIGEKYGNILINKVLPNSGKRPMVEIYCDCGKTQDACVYPILNGKKKSCGCGKIKRQGKIGERFNMLTIENLLGEDESGNQIVECKCECGNKKVTKFLYLKDNEVKSCGCLAGRKYKVVGMIKNDIECLSDVFKVDGKETVRIKCHCGNICDRLFDSFKRGYMKSCGCEIKRYQINIGEKHGRLTIIDILPNNKYGSRMVQAKCECGSVKKYQYGSIINKEDRSCGCRYFSKHDWGAFDKCDNETMYWVGVLAADGCVSKKAVSLSFATKDKEHISKYRQFMKSEHTINNIKPHHTRKGDGSVGLAIKNQKIVDDLIKFGIGERKSLTYDPPEMCASNSHFWRGMIDGDGWITKRRRGVGLCGTLETIHKFKTWCIETCGATEASICKKGKIFSIAFGGNNAKLICEKIYQESTESTRMNRKYDLYVKKILNGVV